MEERIKMRVLNRYRGAESAQFEGGAVPEGAIIHVDRKRMRELIAAGNAAPIVGPSETKPAGGATNAPTEQGKVDDGQNGKAEPLSLSLPALPSPEQTATPQRRGRGRPRKTPMPGA